MYKKASILFINVLLFFQLSHEATIPFGPVKVATEMLTQLKHYQKTLLTGLFATYYVPDSDEVDSAALATKGNDTDEALIKCVNDQATEAISTIFSEYMTYTTYYMKPIAEEEKHLIACALTDEDCVNGVLEELQSIIELLGNNTETEVAADSETIQTKVSLIKACGNQTTDGQNVTGLAVVEAQEALNSLRQVTVDKTVNLANYINMSDKVNSAARSKKAQICTSDEQLECVNGHANEAIDFIYAANLNLTEKLFKRLYDAEIQLVVCGASDEECVKGVVVDLYNKINSTSNEVYNQTQMDSQSVDAHILAMSTCVSTTTQCPQQADSTTTQYPQQNDSTTTQDPQKDGNSAAVVNFITKIENSVLFLFTIIMYIIQ